MYRNKIDNYVAVSVYSPFSNVTDRNIFLSPLTSKNLFRNLCINKFLLEVSYRNVFTDKNIFRCPIKGLK